MADAKLKLFFCQLAPSNKKVHQKPWLSGVANERRFPLGFKRSYLHYLALFRLRGFINGRSKLVRFFGQKSAYVGKEITIILCETKKKVNWHTRCLSVLDFWNVNLGVYYKLEKKSISNQTWFFFEFELDFYCLCSLQKSISKSNWFFNFLSLIFRNWKKIEWHFIFQKSSGDRQGVRLNT